MGSGQEKDPAGWQCPRAARPWPWAEKIWAVKRVNAGQNRSLTHTLPHRHDAPALRPGRCLGTMRLVLQHWVATASSSWRINHKQHLHFKSWNKQESNHKHYIITTSAPIELGTTLAQLFFDPAPD